MFDDDLIRNQDYELNIRLRDNGGLIWFDPKLEVIYRPRPSLGALWKQYFEYGFWKRRVIRMHPGSTRLRQLAPPLFVVALIVSAVLAFSPWPRFGLVVPILYAAVLLTGTLAQLIRGRDSAALGMPIAVMTMHLAWGLGFLRSYGTSPGSSDR